ncbi:hypothetical protein [Streptomyces pseudovenezuelae]|uniref:hypothetical protein n=1 Tax=Streptomyces pseudovenezuelae TaxID=67350 RepID=UPI002E2F0A5A|nr:hypothetical protein [Streptomyces pseudovenezuelae]
MNSLFRKAIEQYFAHTQRAEVEHVIFSYDRDDEVSGDRSFEIRIYTQRWDLVAEYCNQEAIQFLDHLLDYTGA